MMRVQTVVSGVAGSPYYLNGFFDALNTEPQDAIDAWHTFVTAGGGGTVNSYPTGAVITTSGTLDLIDPTDGGIVGQQFGATETSLGGAQGQFLPAANQVLVHWRTGIYVNRRELRGRTNIPCISEAGSTNSGQVEPSVITAYNALGNALISNPDCVFIVWSKKNGEWREVFAAQTWDQFAVLRSRRD